MKYLPKPVVQFTASIAVYPGEHVHECMCNAHMSLLGWELKTLHCSIAALHSTTPTEKKKPPER